MNRIIITACTIIIGIAALIAYAPAYGQLPYNQISPCGPNANGSYTLCTPIPGIKPVQNNFTDFLNQLYRLAIMLAGTIVFIRIVQGGIMYSFSTVIDKKREAKEIFKGVAQGLALLMGAYLILKTINPALTRFDLPQAGNYTDKRNQTLNKNYNDLISKENAANQRAERDAQENLFFVQDYIQSLEDTSDRTPQQEEMLTKLKTERLPEARREAVNRISLSLNEINSRIDDITRKQKTAQGMTKSALQWFPNTLYGVPSQYQGLNEQQQRDLQNLYEQRDSLLKQKQR